MTDEYPCPVISHGQSCGSAACPVDSGLNHLGYCLSVLANVYTVARPSVVCTARAPYSDG